MLKKCSNDQCSSEYSAGNDDIEDERRSDSLVNSQFTLDQSRSGTAGGDMVIWPAVHSRGSSMRLVRNPLAIRED